METQGAMTDTPADQGDLAAGTVEALPLEEIRQENERLKASLRVETARRQITAELSREGARSPELLFETIREELQFDEEGTPANTAALLSTLKMRFPEQFGTEAVASIDGGAGRVTQTALSREALAKMTPAQVAELDWDDVRRVLQR